jgi:subtilisin family serine protease
VFSTDISGHGTNCASAIAGQGRITDPEGWGPSNPLYAGAASVGGVGGAVIQSIAPDVRIAAFQNGFSLPLDAWTLAVLGFDGVPESGDEANIVSNSWGDSRTIQDGWDPVSRFAQNLSYSLTPQISFLAATGNGGHGYGTTTSPGGGSIIDVGASTAYGALRVLEFVTPEQFVSGEIQPWSNRGPGGLGDISPDIVAVGAYATGANPLNIYYGNGESAYDVFGGTSLSTPVAAGHMALVYQAFRQTYSRWPIWEEARAILLNGAQDLGYDVLAQGAGNVQAGQSIAIAVGKAALVQPEQWQAGGYRAESYPAFPAILQPGEQDTQIFTIYNPSLRFARC